MSAPARILIVDDDLPFAQVLEEALSSYDVLVAHTGSAALQFIAQQALDLVLLDNVLPDISGLSVLRVIKKVSPSILVIVMTSFGSEAVSVAAFRNGARDYLRKPFKLSDLLERIEQLLAIRQTHSERRVAALLEARRAFPVPSPGSRAASLQRAITFIEAHYDAQLTLGQVAREAGISKFHFCRCFKEFTGQAFHDFLTHLRITRALELLGHGDRSVTEVCYEVGFADLTHFGRVFRKVTGRNPSHLRRRAIDYGAVSMPSGGTSRPSAY